MLNSILLFLTIVCCCHGFKVYLDQGDEMIDDNEIYKEEHIRSWQWIFPGTKWCGQGDIAENENDLGSAVATDKCCREHDFCDDIIESGQTKYNLTNNSSYTKLNCRCDYKFYECLKSNRLKTSKAVGHVYFNVLGTQCYKNDYPIIRCLEYNNTYTTTRCVKYEQNMNAPKVWQWFDVPAF